MSNAAYFTAGWLTCAVMSGALLLLAVRTAVREDLADADHPDERAGD